MSIHEGRKKKLEALKLEGKKKSTNLMCSKKELLIYTQEISMDNLKVTCMEKSLKASSWALFIKAKLSKKIKKEKS
jgi:hypothetical protein